MTLLSQYYGTVDGKYFFTVEGTAVPGRDRPVVLREGGEDFERWTREQGLFGEGLRLLDGVVTPRGYPIYRTRSAQGVQQLKQRIAETGILLAGRQGGFNYVSSSDAAGDARNVARSFLSSLE